MDFALSLDQKMMQESLAGTLARVSPLERVRAFAEGDEAIARDVWLGLMELGVPGMLIAEDHGGLGLTLLDAALMAETLGAHVAPAPFLGSAILAPLAIMGAGSKAQQAAWLPKLAAGEALAGIAIGEEIAGARDGAGVTCEMGRLTGTALFVIDFAGADVFIVADRSGGVHLVADDAPGLARNALTTIDATRGLGELHLAGTPAEPLTAGHPGLILARLRDAAWTILAADMLGASGVMLDRAVAYAKERRQFGRLIGSFQAVKHMCAEMAAQLEPCRALVWYAAHAFDAIPAEASLAAAHAKAHLSEVSRFVARTATEVHGGIGFTDLLGLHYWFKRVGLDRQLLGGPERVRALAANLQGLTAGVPN
ncbi:MAG: acyl-CoA dehydrogenase family protein [Caulobacteraceae bacterium]